MSALVRWRACIRAFLERERERERREREREREREGGGGHGPLSVAVVNTVEQLLIDEKLHRAAQHLSRQNSIAYIKSLV